MSYDLQVFAQESLRLEDLRQLVTSAGLTLESPEGSSGTLTVLRGAKMRYCFTLGLPVAVEAEDVPEEVTAALLAPTCLYELLVEGSSPSETPHAVRFARRLAEAIGGVVLDQQSGETWHRGKLRTSEPVQRGTIAIVNLTWYSLAQEGRGSAAGAWLDLARRYLPEALPRRFGPVEPLAMKLETDGPQALLEAVAAEGWKIFFKATNPCIEGGLAGEAGEGGLRSHSLSVHREPLKDARWRDSLQRLFVEFAIASGAFLATAEVRRGLEWSGRSLGFTSRAEKTAYLARGGTWAGLLPYPAWWTWFGPAYVPLVVDHLPSNEVQKVGGGLFHSRGSEPLDRDQLLAQLAPPAITDNSGRSRLSRLGIRRPAPAPSAPPPLWLPQELLATVDDSDPNLYNPPLTPARTMPPDLGGTL